VLGAKLLFFFRSCKNYSEKEEFEIMAFRVVAVSLCWGAA